MGCDLTWWDGAYVLAGGAVTVFATFIIDVMGTVGALLATAPTTIVVAVLGVWEASSSASAFVGSMTAVPLGALVNSVALVLWAWCSSMRYGGESLSAKRFQGLLTTQFVVLPVAVLAWLVMAVLVVNSFRAMPHEHDYVAHKAVAISSWLCVTAIGLVSVFAPSRQKRVRGRPQQRRHNAPILVTRFVLGATTVAAAVVFSKLGDEFIAGVAAIFPAMVIATLISMVATHDLDMAASCVGPIVLGTSSIALFALLCCTTVPSMGPGLGTLVAWLVSVGTVSVPLAMLTARYQR